jgi:hypothetical protein
MSTREGKKLLKEFESTIKDAELNALSKASLERPLTDRELARYKKLMFGGL